MKRFLLPLLLFSGLFSYMSCQKFSSQEIINEKMSSEATFSSELKISKTDPFVEKAALVLKDSLNKEEFNSLDFSNYSIYKDEQGNPDVITIFTKNKNETRFIILGFKKGITVGNWVETDPLQQKTVNGKSSGTIKTQSFNKTISSTISFNENKVVQIIRNDKGNVKTENIRYTKNGDPIVSSEGMQLLARPEGDQDGYTWLPEVVVVGYKRNYLGPSFWSLYWAFNQAPTYQYSFTTTSPYQGGGGGGETLTVNPANTTARGPIIRVQNLIKCFTNVPSNGATYSITICTDIPVNSNPNEIMSITGNPGHAFVILNKSGGGQSATRAFGFYPENKFVSLLQEPTPSVAINDAGHEYNASLTMTLTASEFNAALSFASQIPTFLYDLNDNNCTNFALDVINLVRPNPIEVPDTYSLLPTLNYGTTPGGLYKKLRDMKNSNIESGNISIGNFTGPTTGGECY